MLTVPLPSRASMAEAIPPCREELVIGPFSTAWEKDCLRGFEQLHQLLGFEKALEMPHLPDTNGHEDQSLQDGPPQYSLVGALTGLSEALLSPPLVVLLLLDLLHLLHQLSDSQLQLTQLVFGSNFCIIVGMFTHLDIEVNSQHASSKEGELCRI